MLRTIIQSYALDKESSKICSSCDHSLLEAVLL
jgi:hypothetical protein